MHRAVDGLATFAPAIADVHSVASLMGSPARISIWAPKPRQFHSMSSSVEEAALVMAAICTWACKHGFSLQGSKQANTAQTHLGRIVEHRSGGHCLIDKGNDQRQPHRATLRPL